MPKKNTQHTVKQELSELSLLFQISQILDRSVDLRDELGPVLQAIAEHTGMLRGTINLLNREKGEIIIEAAHGLSGNQLKRGRYLLGEGVVGQVVETGLPMMIPNISEEPRFLNKTHSRRNLKKEDISYLCVPIKMGNEILGALSADRLFSAEISLEEDLRLMAIIASMIARAVQLRQKTQEEHEQLLQENTRLHDQLRETFRPANMIGRSNAMEEVFDFIAAIAKADDAVLIRGESGVGKELVAQSIHYNSMRASRPFIRINCGAYPENLIESELFGHEQGAFSGAYKQQRGRIESAHHGTIFLNDIAALGLPLQVKLLRVLEKKQFERQGGHKSIAVNTRIIAGTHGNLEEKMEAGLFHEALYHHLNAFPIHVPPLRKRRTDILELANFFVEKYSELNHKYVQRISTPAIDMLTRYHWPGNVRELETCIERAVLLATDDVVHGHHFPPTLQTAEASNTMMKGKLEETLNLIEREMLIEALKHSRGNKAKAARELGITERLMGLRVKQHGIIPKQFR